MLVSHNFVLPSCVCVRLTSRTSYLSAQVWRYITTMLNIPSSTSAADPLVSSTHQTMLRMAQRLSATNAISGCIVSLVRSCLVRIGTDLALHLAVPVHW